MLGAASYQAQQQSGGDPWGSTGGFRGHMNPEDLFRKIFEEFAGGGMGGSGSSYSYQSFAPMEVFNVNCKLEVVIFVSLAYSCNVIDCIMCNDV